jgi:hypothetical protein
MLISDGVALSSEHLDGFVQLKVDMPPLLLIDLLELGGAGLPPAPHASRFMAAWPECGRTDVVALMARLWLLKEVVRQPAVRLSDLLGGIDVGTNEVVLRVPSSGYALEQVQRQVDQAEFAYEAGVVDVSWAYFRLGHADIDSWMFVRSEPDGKVVSIQLQSRKQTLSPARVTDAQKMFWARGLQHVLLIVTDQRRPEQRSSWLRKLTPFHPRSDSVILITPAAHKQFYSGCRHLLTAALAERR